MKTPSETSVLKTKLQTLSGIPLSFLGFALWRAWVSLSYANPPYTSPWLELGGKEAYDLFLAATCIVVALLFRRLTPLNNKRFAYLLCGGTMVISSALQLLAASAPHFASALFLPASLLAGVGSSFLILFWCEIFSCLSPTKTAVYFSLSMAAGVGITFLLLGFKQEYLNGCLLVLPLLSLAMARRSYTYACEDEPPAMSSRTLFPWKLIIVFCLYRVVNGICLAMVNVDFGALVGSHSTLATLLSSVIFFVCACFLSDRFDFSLLYRSPMALMVCGLLLVPLFGFEVSVAGAFCVSISTNLFAIVVFLFLCDVSKRLEISAVFLFGLEEATLLFNWLGQRIFRLFSGAPDSTQIEPIVTAISVVLIISLTILLLSEREVGVRWGVRIMGREIMDNSAFSEHTRIMWSCEELAKKCNLSPRETEVLKLLAQGKSLSAVARDLFIADGTAKAHTRHIYEKTGAATRQELFDLLKINPGK